MVKGNFTLRTRKSLPVCKTPIGVKRIRIGKLQKCLTCKKRAIFDFKARRFVILPTFQSISSKYFHEKDCSQTGKF